MRMTEAVLVIVDISGYTNFIRNRTMSLIHAEGIITTLLESVVSAASHPLQVNKFEGDAALMFAETHGDPGRALASVMGQVSELFSVFDQRQAKLAKDSSSCPCDACGNGVTKLRLKAFVHVGHIAIKQVLHFEELAGEPVIVIHQLMKNSVPSDAYLLLTEPARELAGELPVVWESASEKLPGDLITAIHWCPSSALSSLPKTVADSSTEQDSAKPEAQRIAHFRNLSRTPLSRMISWARRLFR